VGESPDLYGTSGFGSEFDGVVVTDWLASATDTSVTSLSAGCDVMGGAVASGTDFNTLINAVGWDRLNESARRILDLKLRLGLFEFGLSGKLCRINTTESDIGEDDCKQG
jgi:beta-glucosidase-like glycosyl hydrolase